MTMAGTGTQGKETARDSGAVLGAQHTFEFIQSLLPAGCLVLDAGCGGGLLAKLLLDAGFRVTAIDSKAEAIAECKAIGVEAIESDFLEYRNENQFDAVLLSRALHHMQPLDAALERAQSLLKSNGLLLIEDFGAELVDRTSAVWFYGLKALIEASGVPIKSRGPKLEDGKIPDDPMKSWLEHAFVKHEITPSQEMIRALAERFDILKLERIPYLYRYFLDDVSLNQAVRIFDWEQLLCQEGVFEPIGVRIVAKHRS